MDIFIDFFLAIVATAGWLVAVMAVVRAVVTFLKK